MSMSLPPGARKWAAAALVAAVLFYLVNNGVWLILDRSSPSYDKASHARAALGYLYLLEEPTRLSLTKLLTVTQYYPPLFHVLSLVFTLPLGFSTSAVAATNFLFLPALVLGIYGIGRRFFDEWVGAGAVVLTLLYPMIFAMSRTLLVDFPLTAMVAFSLYYIIASDAGLDERRSVRLGAVIGATMLTKWTAVVFLTVPWAFWLWLVIRRTRPSAKSVLIALAKVCAMAMVIAAPWYIKAYTEFLKTATAAFSGSFPQQEHDPTQMFESLRWYWSASEVALMLKPLLWLTAIGIAAFAVRRRAWTAVAFIACWVIPAFVFFILLPNKDGRYVVPLLPAFALVAAAGFQALPWKAARAGLWAAVVVAGVVQFYGISFGWPATIGHFYTGVPRREDWKIAEVVGALRNIPTHTWLQVGVLPDHPDFETNIFDLEGKRQKADLAFSGFGQIREPVENITNFDAVVLKTGTIAPEHTVAMRPTVRDDIRDWSRAGKHDPYIELVNTWPLPDGSQAEVYRIYAEPKVPDPPTPRKS
jgi:4-amino-4-deoxy-L-arabinose transferase-like glycosyltransferase